MRVSEAAQVHYTYADGSESKQDISDSWLSPDALDVNARACVVIDNPEDKDIDTLVMVQETEADTGSEGIRMLRSLTSGLKN